MNKYIMKILHRLLNEKTHVLYTHILKCICFSQSAYQWDCT